MPCYFAIYTSCQMFLGGAFIYINKLRLKIYKLYRNADYAIYDNNRYRHLFPTSLTLIQNSMHK